MLKIKYLYFIYLVALISFLASGCKTIKAPDTPYETWVPQQSEVKPSQDYVWEFIREQKIDSSKSFSLAELLDIFLKNNPTTKQAWETARASVALKKQAESPYYPQANVGFEINRSKEVSTIQGNSFN